MREITVDDINKALKPECARRKECLCIHAFMQVIDQSGLTCKWCGQVVPPNATSPEYRAIRTAAIRAVHPEWVR